jgi:hypothetical protein
MIADNLIGSSPDSCGGLFREPIEDVDELGEALGPFRIAFRDAVRHALFDVEAEHREADAVERGLGRGELLKDLDAEAWFLNHAPDAADLPFDPIQSGDDRLLLRLVQHASFMCIGQGLDPLYDKWSDAALVRAPFVPPERRLDSAALDE